MDTRTYELMFIASAQLGDTELEALLQRVRRYLEVAEAEILEFKDWGLRRLAYPILKQREGRYYLVHFKASPQSITALDRNLRLIEGFMRHIIVRIEEVLQPPASPAAPSIPEAETLVEEAAPEKAVPEEAAPEEAAPAGAAPEEATATEMPTEEVEKTLDQEPSSQASE